MVRCAYAHGIANPKWNITKDKYKRILSANGLSVDLKNYIVMNLRLSK